MKVRGQRVSVRGSFTAINPQTGAFTVDFDLAMTGNDGVAVKTVSFIEPPADGPQGVVLDLTWGLLWDIIS